MTQEQLRIKKQEVAEKAENIKNASKLVRENNFKFMKPNRKKKK